MSNGDEESPGEKSEEDHKKEITTYHDGYENPKAELLTHCHEAGLRGFVFERSFVPGREIAKAVVKRCVFRKPAPV